MTTEQEVFEQSSSYGESFHSVYDVLFPRESGDQVARFALRDRTPGRVLELGVGTARALVPVAKLSAAECLGLDQSGPMLVRAQEHADEQGAQISLRRHDIRTAVPHEAGQFDLVLCVGGTIGMFVPDQQRQVLEHAARAVAPGGLLILEAHHEPRVRAMHAEGSRIVQFGTAQHPIFATSQYDLSTGEWWLNYHAEPGETGASEFSFTSNATWHDEIVARCGMTLLERVGSWKGDELDDRSPTRISRYEKPA